MGRTIILFIISKLICLPGFCSDNPDTEDSAQVMLLENISIQVQTTQAINDMYNFKFQEAEKQFNRLKQEFPHHPLAYFLLALNEWWKINVNIENEEFDGSFLAYIDTAILRANYLYEMPQYRVESAFFLAAGYGFQGRLYAERGKWAKAAFSGKNSLKYLKDCKEKGYLSPELLFGDALYNYFSVWIPENYPMLKPIMAFFPKGDKNEGLDQMRHVARNAFYTRTEAQYFLMRILATEENDMAGAMQVSEYLNQTFPDNSYFHRFYARMLYSTGQHSAAERVSQEIMIRIDSGQIGYEAICGRYASFYLGQINEQRRDFDRAKFYFQRTVEFAEQINATDSGYYLYALLSLGQIAAHEGNEDLAREYFKKVKKDSRRKEPVNKRARSMLKEM
ncbi:MAG: tetratricopeptide repeat protein [Cyclobacteriaceae bacterium]|nr:tetratricopeptide repeat protein [Cyclobacteriaceae bacterium]